jgi:hypothetical protein
MDDAQLNLGFRKYAVDRLWKARKAFNGGNEDILYARLFRSVSTESQNRAP